MSALGPRQFGWVKGLEEVCTCSVSHRKADSWWPFFLFLLSLKTALSRTGADTYQQFFWAEMEGYIGHLSAALPRLSPESWHQLCCMYQASRPPYCHWLALLRIWNTFQAPKASVRWQISISSAVVTAPSREPVKAVSPGVWDSHLLAQGHMAPLRRPSQVRHEQFSLGSRARVKNICAAAFSSM